MIDTQLMKGILEGCVLSVIAEHETYGYEILQRLTESGFTELGEGTMYPVLTRLEKNGHIKCRKEKSPHRSPNNISGSVQAGISLCGT